MGLFVAYILSHASGRRSYRRVYPEELRPFIPGGHREYKVSLGRPTNPGFLSHYEEAAAGYDSVAANARKRQQGAFDPLEAPPYRVSGGTVPGPVARGG